MFVFLRVDGNHHPGIVGMRPIAARVVGDSEHGDEPVAIEVGWLLARPFGILRIHGGTQISFALARRPLEKCFAGVGRGARDDVESVAGEELFRRGVLSARSMSRCAIRTANSLPTSCGAWTLPKTRIAGFASAGPMLTVIR